MNESVFLNYTHGHVLQSVCSEMLLHTGDDHIKQTCREWIQNEKRNLLTKQPQFWDTPVSTRWYFDTLQKLDSMLGSDASGNAYEEILNTIRAQTREKIHLLFLTQEPACFPSIESVFFAAQAQEDMVATLVFTPFFHNDFVGSVDHLDEYREKGIPVVRYDEYDLVSDSPDVLFMIKPYGNTPEQYQFRELERAIPRTVYIPYGMEITVDLIKYGFQHYLQYKAWRHCAYGEIVKKYATVYGYRNGENVAVWGHPKADLYRDLENSRKTIPEEWSRFINGRKVILWTPHHLISFDKAETGTWAIWGKTILKIAFSNPDIVFLIRPHPLMEGALVHTGTMTRRQLEAMRRKIDASSNILWDSSPDYRNAFYASDAILTDGTTFCVEYLYTKRPIMLTPRNMHGFYKYEEMKSSYYIGQSKKDIEQFVDMIRTGVDPLRERRLRFYDNMFFFPENCTVGENIVKNVKTDLEHECSLLPYETSSQNEQADLCPTLRNFTNKQDFPLVSILILCYKNSSLLYEMLNTVFEQDYPRIQLIVSDDCSSDFDVDQVRAYIDTHRRRNIEDVIVRKNEHNLRTVRHVHEVLPLASGEYVVFTAADDRFVGRDTISAYIEQFLRNPDKLWLVARCQFVSADYSTEIYSTPTAQDEPFFLKGDSRLLFSRWARRGMAVPCCMAWKKEAFETVGGIDLEYQFLEDWPLELKLLRLGLAPIYLPQITAIHSVGGITNSNDRYGKEIRKMFYDDKYLLFQKEVDPNLNLLTPEDRKSYKQYLREIMARNYFLNIDWPCTTTLQKLCLLIKKPYAIGWLFSLWYQKRIGQLNRKKALAVSQAILLLSLLFLSLGQDTPAASFYSALGLFQLITGVLTMIFALLSYPLEKTIAHKNELRKRLVN